MFEVLVMSGVKNNAGLNENVESEAEEYVSDLDRPVWSVISFDRALKRNLTYSEASIEMERQKAQKVSGLCIVTDEAAGRFGKIKVRGDKSQVRPD